MSVGSHSPPPPPPPLPETHVLNSNIDFISRGSRCWSAYHHTQTPPPPPPYAPLEIRLLNNVFFLFVCFFLEAVGVGSDKEHGLKSDGSAKIV